MIDRSEHTSFVPWMKAAGMLLIVFGHVAAWAPGAAMPPINTKQLGVAFFVFVSGYTLAKDNRPPLEIVIRRLFEVLLLAGLLAVLMSLVGALTSGDLLESNYLPLLGGINVFLDYFPANPTTWYVGTYLHLIVLAALLHRGWTPRWYQLGLIAACEVGIRTFLLKLGFQFVPYMLLSNWTTVYTLGRLAAVRPGLSRASVGVCCLTAVLMVALAPLNLTRALPFWVAREPHFLPLLMMSCATTILYAGCTIAGFAAFSHVCRRPPLVLRFVSDHTLLIFLAHMPVYYALRAYVASVTGSRPATAVVLFLCCIALPGGASYLLHKIVDLPGLRDAFVHGVLLQTRRTVDST
jgi:peptidoglycan/LPS O-acetylase OafA/YrhL